jgi:hypothetical protein
MEIMLITIEDIGAVVPAIQEVILVGLGELLELVLPDQLHCIKEFRSGL